MCSTSGQLHSQLHAAIACVSTDSDLSHRIWQAVQESYGAPTRHYHNLQHLHEMLAWLERAAAAGALPSPQPPAVVLAVFFHDIVYDAQRHDNEEASALLAQRMLLEAGAEEQVVNDVVELVLATRKHQLPPRFNQDSNSCQEPAQDKYRSCRGSGELHVHPNGQHQQPQGSVDAGATHATGRGGAPGHDSGSGSSRSLQAVDRAAAEAFLDADLSILAAPRERYLQYSQAIRLEYQHLSDEQFRAGRTAVLERMLSQPSLYFSDQARRLGMEKQARENMNAELLGALG